MASGALHHGFPPAAWERAKGEAHSILINKAKYKTTIIHSELFSALHAIRSDGMLSVIVVHKTGDLKPGFFDLVALLGRDIWDTDVCWGEELNRVCDAWDPAPDRQISN